MKVLAVILCLGCSQVFIDGIVDLFPTPNRISHERPVMTAERWECPKCGNDNGDWTSICGRCGRSRPK